MLEAIQQQELERQRQAAAARDARELALLQGPAAAAQPALYQQAPGARASQEQPRHLLSHQELAALQHKYPPADAAPQVQQPPVPHQYQEQCPLPSPLTSATSNFDTAVAKLLACAGNTTAGPLALGAAQGAAFAGGEEPGEPRQPG